MYMDIKKIVELKFKKKMIIYLSLNNSIIHKMKGFVHIIAMLLLEHPSLHNQHVSKCAYWKAAGSMIRT